MNTAESTSRSSTARTVSLVLGSGGARGLAHIGVIQELEAQGYEIRAIAGSSMGALVGGIYALGELDTYAEWVKGLEQSDVLGLLDWSFSGGGIIRGEKLIKKLKELVGERDIEHLPISYTAVAVDIERGKELWISDGSLFDAIRASIAIPGVFTPHRYRGRTLVDGGLLNPVPVAPTLRTLTDLTIVVDVNGPASDSSSETDEEGAPANGKQGLLRRMRGYVESLGSDGSPEAPEGLAVSEVLMRSLDTMQAALTRQHLAVFRPDLVISVPKNVCMIHEFHRAGPVVDLGRELAREALDSARKASSGPA
ncbi:MULTISPECIES: patatin-like phospholipase family protein [unclassified Ectothiorhodospira]|uniref:patatin-like phospholipase family protein n=1 Tax=unclassified Ectothiorhodospira TaxID=2684909 RepID=UPI001EE8D1B2|nr:MULTISPECIES: patatin-like phospholipase family protein [unclassified Ectothiorhodospira]MCG5515759.1 patatin-like phospholipase family protein [Ectothiorhodospira sp. 9100]MCG5519150.1 patatin-like phospholipase family protein [Ectothiorhodospira sp. 9905]